MSDMMYCSCFCTVDIRDGNQYMKIIDGGVSESRTFERGPALNLSLSLSLRNKHAFDSSGYIIPDIFIIATINERVDLVHVSPRRL